MRDERVFIILFFLYFYAFVLMGQYMLFQYGNNRVSLFFIIFAAKKYLFWSIYILTYVYF